MKAYKVVVLIVDHDDVGDGIKDELENVNYPNDCLAPRVMSIESAEIGEWQDEHPLNSRRTMVAEFERLFPEEPHAPALAEALRAALDSFLEDASLSALQGAIRNANAALAAYDAAKGGVK